MKKKLLIISSIGFLILLVSLLFWRLTQKQIQRLPGITPGVTEQPAREAQGQISQEKAREIAAGIIKWSDGMRSDNGTYYTGVDCSQGSECRRSEIIDKQLGIPIVWARYRSYLNTRNQVEMDKINNDLIALTTLNIGYPAQNDNLNCFLMDEMYKSDIFNNFQKDQIKKICQDGIYYGKEVQNLLEIFQSKGKIEEPAIDKVIAGEKLGISSIANKNNFTRYAIYSADLISSYLWFGDPEDLPASKYFLNLALQFYSQDYPDFIEGPIGLSAIQLYKTTNELKYKLFMDSFFARKREKGCVSSDDCIYYLLFLNEYKNNLQADVPSEIRKTENYLMDNAFDTDSGTIMTLSPGIKSFNIVTNALFAGYLAAK